MYWKLLAIIWAFTNFTFLLVKGLKYCENYLIATPRYKVGKCCLRNNADRLVLCLVATNLQSIKDTMTVKCLKQSVMKQDMCVPRSCTWRINIGKMFILPKAIPQKHANTNNIFHRTEKTDPKFCMELQKTLKSQVMLRKKKTKLEVSCSLISNYTAKL